MVCRYCGVMFTDLSKVVRAYGYDGYNTNFCDKWCCLAYYEELQPLHRRAMALSYWLQRFARIDSKTGKRIIPSRVSDENRKIMETFYFVGW